MLLSEKKIFLRPVLPSDADILYTWENDKANWGVSGTKKPFTKREIEYFISNQKDVYLDKQLRLIICLLSPSGNKSGIGCIDLFNFDEFHLKAGIGILIDQKHRKNGYASEALTLLIRYGFEILDLRKLFCHISEENEASLKLFKKNKFKIIGKKKGICSLQLLNK
ncbi:MAG: GNAT family N-acetyltransferase [Bacteroidetes bacterium]|nr:GNAT family N-acetyltransferase [Bacteroidota bacterium]